MSALTPARKVALIPLACALALPLPLFPSEIVVTTDSVQEVADALAARHAEETARRVGAAANLWLYLEDLEYEEDWTDYLAAAIRAVEDWLAEEKEPWVRFYLLRALADLDDESVRELVLDHLRDREPALRAVAAEYADEVLLDAEPEEAAEVEERLLEAYSARDLWWVRSAILTALGSGNGDPSLDLLHRALADRSRDVRAAASVALRYRRDPRSVSALTEAFEKAGLAGSDSPVAALAAIGGAEALEVVERALESPYPEVRAEAARGIGASARREYVERVAPLLEESDPRVREAAASATVGLGGAAAARALLVAVARAGDPGVLAFLKKIQPLDRASACEWIAGSRDVDRPTRETTARLCLDLETRRSAGSLLRSPAEADAHPLPSLDADLRVFAPEREDTAETWNWAVGEENGGVRVELAPGRRVRVVAGFEYRGQTWLAVNSEPDGLYEIWVRERDLGTSSHASWLRTASPISTVTRRAYRCPGAG